jgi:hypothetical protein
MLRDGHSHTARAAPARAKGPRDPAAAGQDPGGIHSQAGGDQRPDRRHNGRGRSGPDRPAIGLRGDGANRHPGEDGREQGKVVGIEVGRADEREDGRDGQRGLE